MGTFYDAVRRRQNLESAARVVCGKGRSSRSKEVRQEVQEFERRWTSRIQGIERSLRERRFHFQPQRVVLIPRPGKKPRPIVIAPLPNRVVQRAILQVLKEIPVIAEILAIPWSVGGIEGIDKGIALVQNALASGAKWYLRADIPNFFGKVPRVPIVEFIESATSDTELSNLFTQSIATSIVNTNELTREEQELLPDEETGLAQGSALSTLVGNILLRDFDLKMQGDGIRCIRYIDDFIILAQRRSQVVGAFKAAQKMLETWDIKAYEPADGTGKAKLAQVCEGIDFLGCRIDGPLVSPGAKARASLLDEVKQLLADGRHAIHEAVAGRLSGLKGRRESQTLRQVDLVVNGWGQAFAFCNASTVMEALDAEIANLVTRFRSQNARLAAELPSERRGRVIGVTRLCDIPRKRPTISKRAEGYLPNPKIC